MSQTVIHPHIPSYTRSVRMVTRPKSLDKNEEPTSFQSISFSDLLAIIKCARLNNIDLNKLTDVEWKHICKL